MNFDFASLWLQFIAPLAVGLATILATFAVASLIAGLGVQKRQSRLRGLVRRYSGTSRSTTAIQRARLFENRAFDGLVMVASRFTPTKYREFLSRLLARSGRFDAKGAERIAAGKLLLAALGLLLGLAYASAGVGALGPVLVIGLPILGYFALDLWLYDRGVSRQEQIGYELPSAIDLMYLSVSSGVSLNSAMQKVAENLEGPAAAELTRVLEEMRLGLTRPDAFRSLISRVKHPDMIRFAEAMIKIDQLGISLSTVLAEQAREMHERRRTLARERAQKVSVQILLPLVLCFLPGLFLIVLGPAVMSILNLFAK